MTNAVANSHPIQKASEISGLPATTLRYYEDIGLVGPVARDASSGHRRYSDADIDLALAISCLSAAGMSIEEMRTYLANRAQGDAAAPDQIALLKQQQRRLARQAADLKLRQRYIEQKLRYWQALDARDDRARASASVQVKQIAAELHHKAPSTATPDSERSE